MRTISRRGVLASFAACGHPESPSARADMALDPLLTRYCDHLHAISAEQALLDFQVRVPDALVYRDDTSKSPSSRCDPGDAGPNWCLTEPGRGFPPGPGSVFDYVYAPAADHTLILCEGLHLFVGICAGRLARAVEKSDLADVCPIDGVPGCLMSPDYLRTDKRLNP